MSDEAGSCTLIFYRIQGLLNEPTLNVVAAALTASPYSHVGNSTRMFSVRCERLTATVSHPQNLPLAKLWRKSCASIIPQRVLKLQQELAETQGMNAFCVHLLLWCENSCVAQAGIHQPRLQQKS